MKECIIVDLDGTICDVTHRVHHVRDGNKNYDAFHRECVNDPPVDDVVWLVENLSSQYNNGYRYAPEMFAFSGRSSVVRNETLRWLKKHTPEFFHAIGKGARLCMRPEGDHRSDVTFKREQLRILEDNGHEVLFTIDDRQSVVDMWREEGITCLQVNAWEENSTPKFKKGNLFLMVGPSGAGKSTAAEVILNENPNAIVLSSDQIRERVQNDGYDRSLNSRVFSYLHSRMISELSHGFDVVYDATNLRAKGRKDIVKMLPEGVEVTYIIVDRPLEDKLRDGGYRLYVNMDDGGNLVQNHHNKFMSGKKHALTGDGNPDIKIDKRFYQQ